MKIYNSQQTKELDKYTINEQKISSLDLMERAAKECTNWLIKTYTTQTPFVIFCGLGNNGGDGLAIARMLYLLNYNVSVFVLNYSHKNSADFNANLAALKNLIPVHKINNEKDFPEIFLNNIVIDAILGAGINKPITGIVKKLINTLNTVPVTKIAIDVPSGLQYENNVEIEQQTILYANHTLSFDFPKLCFLLPSTAVYVGKWHVLNIQLSAYYKANTTSCYEYITLNIIHDIINPRDTFSHKGTFGHAELIGGSYGKMGAVVLATKAALKTGAGLVTAYTPNCGTDIVQISVPEAMWTNNKESKHFLKGAYVSAKKTVGIGPGMGTNSKTSSFLKQVLQNTTNPMVVDADALNILSKNMEWMAYLPKLSILTPHPKEFKRLVGNFTDDTDKLNKLKIFANTHKCIVVLKGAHTTIAVPNHTTYINSTGNSGMATAGSGDVLTGIITSLLAQNYTPIHAALLGVYLHGLSGDLAIEKTGKPSLIASDLIAYLGKAYLHIQKNIFY